MGCAEKGNEILRGFGLDLFFCEQEENQMPDLWGKKKNPRAMGAAATGSG